MFKIGDKVICVEETGDGILVKGEAYQCLDTEIYDKPYLYVKGSDGSIEAWDSSRFRLLPEEVGIDSVKASSTQIGGTHYTSMGIQPFEFTYANYGYMGLKAAVHTKVNKYLGRVKDNEIEQLKKARHCIDILIEKAELEAAK